MITFANQKVVNINKPTYESMFLSVGIDEWVEASKILTPNTFKVYLYLCGNKNGFELALSKQAVVNLLGISGDSYKRAVKELTDKGYIVFERGNIYNFYTTPVGGAEMPLGAPMPRGRVQGCPQGGCMDAPSVGAPVPPEISKQIKKDNLSNNESEQSSSSLGANAPVATPPTERKKKRTLEELSNEELISLKDDFEAEVTYPELYEKYNICKGKLDKNLCTKIDNILSNRQQDENKEKIINSLKEDEYSSNELKKLMHLTDEELVDFLSSLDEIVDPFEVVCFFEEHSIFTYEEYLHEDTKLTYFEWFKMGMTNNFKRW